MPYGDFTGPIQYDNPKPKQDAPKPQNEATGTDEARGFFGLMFCACMGLSVIPLLTAACLMGAVLFGFLWIVSPVIKPVETKALISNGGGTADLLVVLLLAGLIIAMGVVIALGVGGVVTGA